MKKTTFFLIVMILLPLALNAQSRRARAKNLDEIQISTTLSEPVDIQLGQEYEKRDLAKLMEEYSLNPDYSSFEINEEMFKAFSELDYADSITKALFEKIKSVKMIEVRQSEDCEEQAEMDPSSEETLNTEFYNYVTSVLELSDYNTLLKSSNSHSVTLLLKKELGEGNNEFLLITDKVLIDIQGDIVIKTIYQMQEMMQYVQQILPN
ncbi:MAG: DUF4252 domain-containing protein [Bacteroidota bacterium]